VTAAATSAAWPPEDVPGDRAQLVFDVPMGVVEGFLPPQYLEKP
jgi:hypothetical protein